MTPGGNTTWKEEWSCGVREGTNEVSGAEREAKELPVGLEALVVRDLVRDVRAERCREQARRAEEVQDLGEHAVTDEDAAAEQEVYHGKSESVQATGPGRWAGEPMWRWSASIADASLSRSSLCVGLRGSGASRRMSSCNSSQFVCFDQGRRAHLAHVGVRAFLEAVDSVRAQVMLPSKQVATLHVELSMLQVKKCKLSPDCIQ